MNFLYEYMTEDELEIAQECALYENEAFHLEMEYKELAIDHELRINDIDTKLIVENLSSSDLEDLYIKEQVIFEEAKESLWQKFKNWISNIINAILGRVKKEEKPIPAEKSNDEIEVDVNPHKLNELADKAPSLITKALSFKTENGEWNIKKIAAVAGSAILIGGTATVAATTDLFKGIFTKTKLKISELMDFITSIPEKIKKVKNATDSLDNGSDAEKKEAASLGTSIMNTLNKGLKFLINAKNRVLGGAKKIVKGKKLKNNNTDNNTDNSDNSDTKTNKSEPLTYTTDYAGESASQNSNGGYFTEFANNFEEIDDSFDLDMMLESYDDSYNDIFEMIETL